MEKVSLFSTDSGEIDLIAILESLKPVVKKVEAIKDGNKSFQVQPKM
jgi:hypothetical protein